MEILKQSTSTPKLHLTTVSEYMYWVTFHHWLIQKPASSTPPAFWNFEMIRAWRNMVHLTVNSHFLLSNFHCKALLCVVTQTLQSHTWKDLTPLSHSGISWSLLGSLRKWSGLYKRDLQSKIVPPTLTAGQLLGSSRLIIKLKTHGGRVSKAGQISFLVDCERGVSIMHN